MSDSFLRHLRQELIPQKGAYDRVREKMDSRIKAPSVMLRARAALTPDAAVKRRVWEKISGSLSVSVTLLDRLREFLTQSTELRDLILGRVMRELAPEAIPVRHTVWRWVAVVTSLTLIVRFSPLLFLPTQILAESPVTLMPGTGTVSYLDRGLFQPVTKETILERSILLQSRDGTSTVVFRDDGVVRLDHATLAIHNLGPADSSHDPTMTLHAGEVWVQGFMPSYVPGWVIDFPQGRMVIHQGSVSLSIGKGDVVDVRVWNGSVAIIREGQELTLVAGEKMQLWTGNVPTVRRIPAHQYDDPKVAEHLKMDAVHQKEIAQWQHERRAASAGILPTSAWYPVKRVAEAVDGLFAVGKQAQAQNRLQRAENRLNEAAALFQAGNTEEGVAVLKEYKEALHDLVQGTGAAVAVQPLVTQQLATTSADISAALPGDGASYELKKAVLEVAAFSGSLLSGQELKHVLIADALTAVTRKVEEGRSSEAAADFAAIKSTLPKDLTDTREGDKELSASLSTLAILLSNRDGADPQSSAFLKQVAEYLPAEPTQGPKVLNDEEMTTLIAQIYESIFVFKSPRSRWNQLMFEFRMIEQEHHGQRASILRRLYQVLPENGLARYVRSEITRLRKIEPSI